MQTPTETIEHFATQEYQFGFITDVEQEIVPARLERGRHPADLGQEGRAGVDAGVAPQGLPPLAHHGGAEVGERPLPADRLPVDRLLRGPQAQGLRAEEPGRGRSGDPGDLREAGHPAPRAGAAGRRGGGRGVRQRLGGHHLQGEAGRDGDHLLLLLRGGAGTTRTWCRSTWARWCPTRTTSSPRSTRRCSPTARSSTSRRACAARWSCRPTSGSTPATPGSSSAR